MVETILYPENLYHYIYNYPEVDFSPQFYLIPNIICKICGSRCDIEFINDETSNMKS